MKSKVPTVSVLIPSYNYANYLPEAIESVLAQSFQDFELIIVDNRSTDDTVQIVQNYMKKDSRIKLHINDANIGMYPNYNQALLLAKGEYIKFLNADDKFHPSLLEKFLKIFQDYPNVSLVTSHKELFGTKSKVIAQPFCGLVKSEKAIIKALLDGANWIGEPTTVMFKRKNITIGSFDTSLLMFADFDMWLRQLQLGDLYIIEQVLSYFREHPDQGTKNLNDSKDKQAFSFLQFQEYKRFALQTNRYGYNIQKEYPKESKKIFFNLTVDSMKYFRYGFSHKAYSPHIKRYMLSFFLEFLINIPKKNIYRLQRSFKKRFKKQLH